MTHAHEKYRGALLGLACGDAVGTAVEFKPRGSFPPLTDMVGGGPFGLTAGEWTDDTSMALCLATSLLECNGFDAADQMQRYCDWMDSGYLSSNGRCFDVGLTIASALRTFKANGNPYAGSVAPDTAGNGSLMRLAPVPMYFASDREMAIWMSAESSKTTHGAPECVDAVRLFSAMLLAAFAGTSKEEILFGQCLAIRASRRLADIAGGSYRNATSDVIDGTGYVVDSLEAALWSFLTTGSFREAVLAAANLGGDADTTAAVCGQLAGAYYGESGIPEEWIARLARADLIRSLADRLYLSAFVA